MEEETVEEGERMRAEENQKERVDTAKPVMIAEEDVQPKRQSNRIKEQGDGASKSS